MEIPEQMVRKGDQHGRKAGWSYGIVDGTSKSLRRFGYGVYEIFTFYCPTYHGTYKPPYAKCGQDWRVEMNPQDGLSEFPPELGFETYFRNARAQKY
ncbi:MAG: exosortase system-associated protein, TIGR04073 family, partial [SAR202 cluster bacterium]|nr:exosortase system-associated protein, TIGR04073 family [SAR202 cluster bacterium]